MADRASQNRSLRADAARNRARIMDAARRVFAARGLDVSMDEIAEAACLGVTTVTRRFPDRNSLVEALFEAELATNIAAARTALAAPDAGEGLAEFLRLLFRRAATDRGIWQVILSARYGLGGIAAQRRTLIALIHEVVERAHDDGRLREGAKAADIPVLMLMVGSVADFAAGISPELWERYSELLIDSVIPSPGNAAWPGAALTPAQLGAAMAQWRPPATRL